LQLFIFVMVELASALQHLNAFGLLTAERVECSLFGLLLVAELASPFGFHLSGADDDHLGVFRDGFLRNAVLQFMVGLLGD